MRVSELEREVRDRLLRSVWGVFEKAYTHHELPVEPVLIAIQAGLLPPRAVMEGDVGRRLAEQGRFEALTAELPTGDAYFLWALVVNWATKQEDYDTEKRLEVAQLKPTPSATRSRPPSATPSG